MSLRTEQIAGQWWILGTGLPVMGGPLPGIPTDAIGPYSTLKEARDDLKGLARFAKDNKTMTAREAFIAAKLRG